jgi:hypothetical protein
VSCLEDPSNVSDDFSLDENRNSQVQVTGAQILKNNKVILRQAVSLPHSNHKDIPFKFSQEAAIMKCDTPLTPKGLRTYKAKTPVDKGMKVLHSIIPSAPPSDSPVGGRTDKLPLLVSRQSATSRNIIHLERCRAVRKSRRGVHISAWNTRFTS